MVEKPVGRGAINSISQNLLANEKKEKKKHFRCFVRDLIPHWVF